MLGAELNAILSAVDRGRREIHNRRVMYVCLLIAIALGLINMAA